MVVYIDTLMCVFNAHNNVSNYRILKRVYSTAIDSIWLMRKFQARKFYLYNCNHPDK